MTYSTDRLASPLARELFMAGLIAALLMAFSLRSRPPPPVPIQDAASYVRLALGLSEFGVFGYFKSPDRIPHGDAEVTPLYPAFLALLMRLGPDLRESLRCLMTSGPSAGVGCPQDFSIVTAAQGLLMAVFLLSVWLTAWVLGRRRTLAWVAMLMAFWSGIPAHFARLFLTEALVLPLFGFLLLSMALVYLNPQRRRWVLSLALVLGLLTLARPAFLYLFWFFAAVATLAALWLRAKKWIARSTLVLCLGFALVTLPWAVRNYVQFGQLSLSAGQYGDRTLAQRVSYNSMTAAEWGVAFIYWFPDIGDSLARSLFPARLSRRLGWGQDSFYRAGAAQLAKARAAAQARAQSPVAYMVEQQILKRPLKHSLVTLALAWRGMFISKYWGIFGWICAIWLLGHTIRRGQYAYAFLWVPGFFMLGFYAAVSVNITRYNIILTPLLAIALAYVLLDLLERRFGLRALTSADERKMVSELPVRRDPEIRP